MRRSIRWRLQLWYGLVLLAVVAGFAGILYARVRSARLLEVDADLEAAAYYLDANLRRFPPHDLLGQPAPDRPPPDEDNGPFDHPPPPPPGRLKGERPPPHPPRDPRRLTPERLLADLVLPRRPDPPGAPRRPAETYFAIWRENDTILKADNLPEGVVPPQLPEPPEPRRPRLAQRGDYHEAVLLGPFQTRILVGKSVSRELAEVRAFAWQLAGVGGVVLALGLAGGWLVSARILRPVAAISATASAISATNLSDRIDAEAVDRELAELARVLNAMFDRLEAAFERQARFTADASHELRTPLAIIRSNADLALARPRSAEEYRDTVETCQRASNRMTALVEGLLTLARADAGKLDPQRQHVALGPLVEECVHQLRPLAQGKNVTLQADLAPVEVTGDPVRLAQVVTNLLGNAVQYNRPGGAVHIRLEAGEAGAVLSVRDTGVGIPEEDRPHIFERFYRVDKARARTSGGNGLGLAICKSIVEAHGGTIGFETRAGEGTTFWVRLPAGVD